MKIKLQKWWCVTFRVWPPQLPEAALVRSSERFFITLKGGIEVPRVNIFRGYYRTYEEAVEALKTHTQQELDAQKRAYNKRMKFLRSLE